MISASFSSRYATVALSWVVVGVTVIVSTEFSTDDRVARRCRVAKTGSSVPSLSVSPVSVASVEARTVKTGERP